MRASEEKQFVEEVTKSLADIQAYFDRNDFVNKMDDIFNSLAVKKPNDCFGFVAKQAQQIQAKPVISEFKSTLTFVGDGQPGLLLYARGLESTEEKVLAKIELYPHEKTAKAMASLRSGVETVNKELKGKVLDEKTLTTAVSTAPKDLHVQLKAAYAIIALLASTPFAEKKQSCVEAILIPILRGNDLNAIRDISLVFDIGVIAESFSQLDKVKAVLQQLLQAQLDAFQAIPDDQKKPSAKAGAKKGEKPVEGEKQFQEDANGAFLLPDAFNSSAKDTIALVLDALKKSKVDKRVAVTFAPNAQLSEDVSLDHRVQSVINAPENVTVTEDTKKGFYLSVKESELNELEASSVTPADLLKAPSKQLIVDTTASIVDATSLVQLSEVLDVHFFKLGFPLLNNNIEAYRKINEQSVH